MTSQNKFPLLENNVNWYAKLNTCVSDPTVEEELRSSSLYDSYEEEIAEEEDTKNEQKSLLYTKGL